MGMWHVTCDEKNHQSGVGHRKKLMIKNDKLLIIFINNK